MVLSRSKVVRMIVLTLGVSSAFVTFDAHAAWPTAQHLALPCPLVTKHEDFYETQLQGFLKFNEKPLFKIRGTEYYTKKGYSISEQLRTSNQITQEMYGTGNAAHVLNPDSPREFQELVDLVTDVHRPSSAEKFKTEAEEHMKNSTGYTPFWELSGESIDASKIKDLVEVRQFIRSLGGEVTTEGEGFVHELEYFNLFRNKVLAVANEHDLQSHALMLGYPRIRGLLEKMSDLYMDLFLKTKRRDLNAAKIIYKSISLEGFERAPEVLQAFTLKQELEECWANVGELLTFRDRDGSLQIMGGIQVFHAISLAHPGNTDSMRTLLTYMELNVPTGFRMTTSKERGLSTAVMEKWIRDFYQMEPSLFFKGIEEAFSVADRELTALAKTPGFLKLTPQEQRKQIVSLIDAAEKARLGGKTYLLNLEAVLGYWEAKLRDVESDLRRLFP